MSRVLKSYEQITADAMKLECSVCHAKPDAMCMAGPERTTPYPELHVARRRLAARSEVA
jgi:hypothetical protein